MTSAQLETSPAAPIRRSLATWSLLAPNEGMDLVRQPEVLLLPGEPNYFVASVLTSTAIPVIDLSRVSAVPADMRMTNRQNRP
jgi:hypothetical protein